MHASAQHESAFGFGVELGTQNPQSDFFMSRDVHVCT